MEIVKKIAPTKKDDLFSIIIPSWNNLALLKCCIESIRKNSSYHHQIIIHINEGSDGTLSWINSQNDISYTFSKENIGVCYALNIAATLVQTEFIVYLNDDMYVCPQWDLVLKKEIDQLGQADFFLSSTMIEPQAQSNCSIQKDFGRSLGSFEEHKLLSEYNQFIKADWNGATWPPNIVRKNTWDLVGGYSIEFSPGMYSDPDFSMKLWQAGIRIFKGCGESKVYHFGSQTVKRIEKNKGYYQFIKKWNITSSTFDKYYIKRGQSFQGVLQAEKLPFFVKLKNCFKRMVSQFIR